VNADKRRRIIIHLLEENGEVKINELANRFGISGNSIRADLDYLAKQGLLTRLRGGAVAGPTANLSGNKFSARFNLNRREKELIGKWAAGLVRDGDAIILDDSSSVFHLAKFLSERNNLAVVTNGLEVALLLAQNPTNKVMLAANNLSPEDSSLIGKLNPDLLEGFLAARCFISCAGFSIHKGLSETSSEKALLKSQMIGLARQVILLIDQSKIENVNTFRSISLNQIDHLITDQCISPEYLANLRKVAGFRVTCVGENKAETLPPAVLGGKRYRIGFGNMTERMVFAQQVRTSLEMAAKNIGNLELIIRDNNLDRQTALDNADWFVENGVDVVIEYQFDAAAGNVIMDKFNRAGLPVIAVDIPLPGATYFGADNYRAGRMAGEGLGYWIKENWDGLPDLILKLDCMGVGSVGAARLQGQLEGLESVIGPLAMDCIKSIDCPVIMEDVPSMIRGFIQDIPANSKIAIIAINDDAAVGTLVAFEKAGRLKEVVAVGQNVDNIGRAALQRPDFPLIGSTSYLPENYGESLINLALRISRGEPVPPAVYVNHTFVTKKNILQFYPGDTDDSNTSKFPARLSFV
jgi:ribose transport system substrate-binding protein